MPDESLSSNGCCAVQMTGIEAEVVSKICSQDAVQVCLALQELLNESELVNSTSGFESNEGISMVPAVRLLLLLSFAMFCTEHTCL